MGQNRGEIVTQVSMGFIKKVMFEHRLEGRSTFGGGREEGKNVPGRGTSS